MKLINKNNINPQIGILCLNEHCMEEQDMIHLVLPGYTGWFMITLGDDIPGLCYLKKVYIDMYPILDGNGVMAVWNLEDRVRIIKNKWNEIINRYNT